MIKVKLGTDISIRWAVLTENGLNDTDFRLEITDSRMNRQILDFIVEDSDHIFAIYKGIDQKYLGTYSLTIWRDNGIDSITCIDRIWAFELVPFITKEDNSSIELHDKIQIGFKGDKGDPFTYDKFTIEQIAELQKPATDAALRTNAALMDLQAVSTQIIEQENLRTQSENNRFNAELDRIESENYRIASECDRISAENLRITVEADRINSENLRAAAEEQRIDNENTRITAETQRQTAEIVRETTETKRIASEQNRDRSEILRTSAETIRQEAEIARQAAERQRATAEAERQETMTEIDTIMQGVVTAQPTDSTLRDIEPNIVTDALRKTPQHLTPDEQAQVKANLAITELTTAPGGDIALTPDGQLSLTDLAKKRLFIDLWNEACGSYGHYNDATGYFELNSLTDITYQQAIAIYVNTIGSKNTTNLAAGFDRMKIRTNLPFATLTKAEKGVELGSAFRLSDVEVVNLDYQYNSRTPLKIIDSAQWIFQSDNLHTVIGIVQFDGTSPYFNGFGAKLKNIKIAGLKNTITFQNCPLISFESLQFVVDNATNTTTITITVHPDVYTKLTDENNIEWHQLMLDAAAKNIQFATV